MELKSIYAQDQRGNVLPGASAALYLAGSLTLASGLLRKDGSSLPNPFAADSTGLIELIAPDGAYDLVVDNSAGSLTQRLVFFSAEDAVITPLQFGAKGDGVLNDTAKFTELEAVHQGKAVDLAGRTYLVHAFPTGNRYYNGNFKRVSDSANVQSAYNGISRTGNNNVFIGRGVASNLTDYSYADPLGSGRGYNLTAVGAGAMGSAGDDAFNCSAFGRDALFSNQYARYNEAFGSGALYFTIGAPGDLTLGTRNTAVGSNVMRFNTLGYSNCAMGRNANQIASTGTFNVFLGAGSGAGAAPLDITGQIVNPYPRTASLITAVGTNTLSWTNGAGNSAFGNSAAQNVKLGTGVVAVGNLALNQFEIGVSPIGTGRIPSVIAGTWSQSGNILTFSIPSHGLSIGFIAQVTLNTGAPSAGGDVQDLTVVTVTDANTWTAQAPDSATRSGNCTMSSYYNTTPVTPSIDTTAIGSNAMGGATSGSNNFAGGAYSLYNVQSNNNTAVGALSANALVSGTQVVALGYSSLRNSLGSRNTAAGEFSLGNLVTGNDNSGFGRSALRNMVDGSAASALSNCSSLGADTRVSGDNQIQLGNSTTTTYVFGTVQNRSDARDKTEIRDTVLGLDFINSLRPVDFKWDMRDDYIETYQEEDMFDDSGNPVLVEKIRILPKDGSKKRNRYHHGLIAQEVQAVIEATGIDFGGYQDHLVEDGCDVKTIGYDELIGPLIKAVQQLSAEIKELRAASVGGSQP